jgi:KipI family sensor histidine kinase inhibitor
MCIAISYVSDNIGVMASPVADSLISDGHGVPRARPCGDAALAIEFGRIIDPAVIRRVLALDHDLSTNPILGIVETVPTYRSLLVHYDPARHCYGELAATLVERAQAVQPSQTAPRRWLIPVVYGGEHGIDLDDVARNHGLTSDEVVARHSGVSYLVAMIGFTPGFAYLSGLDPVLETPRRPSPRTDTPPGTISIGGVQACVQCLASPSGWHLLGRTPVRTFHPARDPMFLLEPGDEVRFVPIAAKDFDALDRAAERGDTVAELQP